MAYRGKSLDKKGKPFGVYWLGIKPTEADHTYVKALSTMGIGVRQITARLKERFNLPKEMSRATLYHHFRKDLIPKVRGRKMLRINLKHKVEVNMYAEMQRMLKEVSKHAAKVRNGKDKD